MEQNCVICACSVAAVHCPAINLENTFVDKTATVYNSVVNVTCEEGYHIRDLTSLSVVCTHTGVWSEPNPTCSRKYLTRYIDILFIG